MSRFAAKRGKKLPGAEFTWDDDPGGEPDTAPTPLFPKYKVPRAEQLTPLEQSQVDYYRSLREKIHDGPYYTVLGNDSFEKNSREHFDPFQGMPTYGERFRKKTRTLPKLTGRPYVINLFPKDLWSTLDLNYVGLNKAQGGAFGARRSHKRGFEDDTEEHEIAEEGSKRRNVGEDGKEGGEEDDDEGDDPLADEEEQDEEEIVDDDFSEDEEDMGGDYNAEQYFDGGDDDGDGYDGGGGDDNDIY
ncbi:hypothetical protein FQN54_007569 [Arachnomyces sp. PD_36]|nr:hypothetical protein FQN54_007569 [Arachnomyces sp. PD_36]